MPAPAVILSPKKFIVIPPPKSLSNSILSTTFCLIWAIFIYPNEIQFSSSSFAILTERLVPYKNGSAENESPFTLILFPLSNQ